MHKLKFISLMAMVGLIFSMMTACSSGGASGKITKEIIFDFYSKVQIGQTKAQVDTALGVAGTESTQLKGSFTYTDPDTSYGVSVLYDDKSLVTSKTLIYPKRADLAFLCVKKVTQAQADQIVKGTTHEQVDTALGGAGIETSSTQIAFDGNKLSSIFIWVNPNGSMIQVVFGTDGKSQNATFFD